MEDKDEILDALYAAFYRIVGLTLASAVQDNDWRWPADTGTVDMTAEKIRAILAKHAPMSNQT